ncbi:hypothetical protein KFL_010890010, partial [Klebsormidium nitens]
KDQGRGPASAPGVNSGRVVVGAGNWELPQGDHHQACCCEKAVLWAAFLKLLAFPVERRTADVLCELSFIEPCGRQLCTLQALQTDCRHSRSKHTGSSAKHNCPVIAFVQSIKARDAARLWAEIQPANQTWAEFVLAFNEEYGVHNREKLWLDMLNKRQGTSSVGEYTTDMLRFFILLDIPENERVRNGGSLEVRVNMASSPRGACAKVHKELIQLGGKDGCQEFKPSKLDPETCKGCECDRTFHEKLKVGPAQQPVGKETAGAQPLPKGGHLSEGEDEEVLMFEHPPKKVKLEGEKKDGAAGGLQCPDVTRKSFKALTSKRPFEKYGEYELKINAEGGKPVWAVWCTPCGKFFKPNSSNGTLKNFEGHLSGATHEASLAKAEKKGREDAEKAATLLAKRTAMVEKHESDGAVLVVEENWRCTLCSFSGTFGGGDTIANHVRGQLHQAAVAAAVKGKPAAQRSIADVWNVAAAEGRVQYPLGHAPSISDIPSAQRREHFAAMCCHGFYANELKLGDEVVSIASLKNDLHRGGEWYTEPEYIFQTAEGVTVVGTFCHVDCERYDCTKCPLIPRCPDFWRRVERAAKAELTRGERVCEPGVGFENLQRGELIESLREFQKRCHSLRQEAFYLNSSLTRLRKSVVSVSGKVEEALHSGDPSQLAEMVRRACDLGAFSGRTQLYNFLLDLAKNLVSVTKHDGDARGKRYHKSTVLMFETLARFGGPLAHNFASLNLLGPVLNTSLAQYRKEAFHFPPVLCELPFEQAAKVLSAHKQRLGISGHVPIECSEDETASIRLATWHRASDTIVGFCGELPAGSGVHSCSFDCQPSASSLESIQQAFKNLKVGSMSRLLLLNPLVVGLPRLVYAFLPTCNMFSAAQVMEQWKVVRGFHGSHLSDIGPLISHASDGDKRRVRCMLSSIGRGSYGLDHPTFVMKAEVSSAGPILMNQDPNHNAKKLRNSILSSTRNVFWGLHLATKNHLALVREHFTRDQHGLLEEDVDVKDKQNTAAAHRLAFPKVRACLEKVCEGFVATNGTFVQEDCTGTIAHLLVLGMYLDIFFGAGTLFERIKSASFVVHMLFFASEFIRHRGAGHTLKENWVTREAQLDMLISCHAAVNLIRLMRDRFPHLPVALHLFGTECCEETFSLIGQAVVNKHNYTYGEALERLSHIGRTAAVQVDADSPLFASNRRRKNLWHEGTEQPVPTDLTAVLSDYASVSEPKALRAWELGLESARERASSLGMREVLEAARKWDSPVPFTLREAVAAVDLLRTEEDEGEEAGSSEATTADAGDAARLPDDAIDVRAAVLDAAQQLGDEEGDTAEVDGGRAAHGKVPSTVDVPGKGPVYKMRVISELNKHPGSLPLDWLRRVQVRDTPENTTGADGGGGEEVGLFDVVAVYFVNGPLAEADSHQWYLGRIQKMFKKYATGARVDYVLPVSLGDERDPAVHLVLKYFTRTGTKTFVYGGQEAAGEADPISLGSVIGNADLRKDDQGSAYTLSDSDLRAFEAFVANEVRSQQLAAGRRARPPPGSQAAEAQSRAVAGTSTDCLHIRNGHVQKRLKQPGVTLLAESSNPLQRREDLLIRRVQVVSNSDQEVYSQEPAQKADYTVEDVQRIVSEITFGKTLTPSERQELEDVIRRRITSFSRYKDQSMKFGVPRVTSSDTPPANITISTEKRTGLPTTADPAAKKQKLPEDAKPSDVAAGRV